MNEKQQLKGLQSFLIRHFVITLILTALVEYSLSSWLNKKILPFLQDYFFHGKEMGSVGIFGILSALFIVLVVLVLELLQILFPGRFQSVVANGFALASEKLGITAGSSGFNGYADLSKAKEILLFLCLVGIVLVMVLPIALGAVYSVRIVIREFNKIEDARVKKQREYERKRNLMLSDIAHDLRTPITTVNGYAKALSDGLVKEDRKQEYLDAIMAKSERMNELITYLFDYVKTDSEGFQLKKEKTDICELVRECAALQYQDMEDAGMEPDIDIPEEPVFVMADKLQLSRSVTNLLTNAIRHNQEGSSIGIALRREESGARIFVSDNGEPIEKEMAEHLFEPFVMGDQSRNTKGGSGLGLSIVKKIVDLHGFEIKLIQKPELAKLPAAAAYEKAFVIRIPEKQILSE